MKYILRDIVTIDQESISIKHEYEAVGDDYQLAKNEEFISEEDYIYKTNLPKPVKFERYRQKTTL